MSVVLRLTLVFLAVLIIFQGCAAPPRPSYQPSSQTNQPATQPNQSEKQAIEDSNVEHVRNVVNLRQAQLQNLYKKQSNVQAMQGELNIKLYISEEGIIQQADVYAENGNLSHEFISQVQNEIMTWKFIVRNKIIYSFKIQFRKM